VSLRHGTDGFASPPKEGMLKQYFARRTKLTKIFRFLWKFKVH